MIINRVYPKRVTSLIFKEHDMENNWLFFYTVFFPSETGYSLDVPVI